MVKAQVMLGALIVIAGAVVLVALAYLVRLTSREEGRAAADADRAKDDLAIAKKQAEIMGERREVKDAADDLDAGRF